MNSNDDSCDINEISCLGNSKISIQVVDYNFGKFVKTYEQYVTKKGIGFYRWILYRVRSYNLESKKATAKNRLLSKKRFLRLHKSPKKRNVLYATTEEAFVLKPI